MCKFTELIENLLHIFLAGFWSQGMRSRQGFPQCHSAQGWSCCWDFWLVLPRVAKWICRSLALWVSKGWGWICTQGWVSGAAHNSSLHPETRVSASDSARSRIWPLRLLSHSYFCHLGQSPWTWMQVFFLGDLIFGTLGNKFKDWYIWFWVGGQVVYLDIWFYGPPKPHTHLVCMLVWSVVAARSVVYLSKN